MMKQFFLDLADHADKFAMFSMCIAIAMFGSVAKYVSRVRAGEKFSLAAMVGECFMAGFSGTLMFLVCSEFEFSVYVTGFMAGMSGYIGGKAMELFESSFVAMMENWTKKFRK
jgi:hypothetical protein